MLSGCAVAALLVSALLLAACGQPGKLYMPETYYKGQPPPKPPKQTRVRTQDPATTEETGDSAKPAADQRK